MTRTLDSIIQQFYGDLSQWPMTTDGAGWTQPQIIAICKRILETGDCFWHAQSVMMVWTNCPCAKCSK